VLRYRALAVADAELDQAASYYESERPGVGKRFVQAYLHRLEIACRFPNAGRLLSRSDEDGYELRAFVIGGGFPYSIVAAMFAHEVVVLAVAHQHREPGYWTKRLDPR
jgi:plasmid stabilization system protein ParE